MPVRTILGQPGSVTTPGTLQFGNPEAFAVVPITSGVNFVEVDGSIAGVAPTIAARGSDTNIGLIVMLKGTNTLQVQSQNSGIIWFQVTGPATSASPAWMVATGEDNSSPGFDAHGTQTNISAEYHAKGAATVDLGNYTGPVTWFSAGGPGTGNLNYLVVNAQAPGTTPQLASKSMPGGDANPNIGLAPQGSGAVQFMYALTALGGGAAPTLGTIGGSGPTAAAQNTWLKLVDNNGNAFWVPVWK